MVYRGSPQRHLLAVTLGAMVGCGVSGSGSRPAPEPITFSPAAVEIRTFDDVTSGMASVQIQLTPPPALGASLVLTDNGQFFQVPGGLTPHGGGAYTLFLFLPDGKPPGIYRGTILARHCTDSLCTSAPIASRSLAYTVTIQDRTAVTQVSARPLSDTRWSDETARVSSLYFDFSPAVEHGPYLRLQQSPPFFAAPSPTLSLFSVNRGSTGVALLPYPDGLAPGTYTGTLTVQLCGDVDCADPYALTSATVPYQVTIQQRAP